MSDKGPELALCRGYEFGAHVTTRDLLKYQRNIAGTVTRISVVLEGGRTWTGMRIKKFIGAVKCFTIKPFAGERIAQGYTQEEVVEFTSCKTK